MKHGQNRRRYRAIAATERVAEWNEESAARWRRLADRDGTRPDYAAEYRRNADGHARTAREQRAIVATLMQRVNFSDPHIHR